MNLNNIPPGCLYDAMNKLEPTKVALLSQTNDEMANLCLSRSLWKDLYASNFPTYCFQTKRRSDSVDWLTRYANRHAIVANIKTHKPKVKSFVKDDILHVRTLKNAFAYNTSNSISLVVYDYFDSECLYEEAAHFDVPNQDFVFLESHSIVSVDENNISLFDINTQKKVLSADFKFGKTPHLQSIGTNSLAVICSGQCVVYDYRDNSLDRRCVFTHRNRVISTASDKDNIFIASEKDLTSHDTRNSRGPIHWNHINTDGVKYCSFNTNVKRATFGTDIVDLNTGQKIVGTDIQETVCGAIATNNVAVFGCEHRAVVFYDFEKKKIIGSFQFGETEGIKSIDSSISMGNVAVAADYNIKILKVPNTEVENVEEVRNVICGSIAQRKSGQIGAVRQIVFDNERLITNMGKFVRVYDFYTGKPAVSK